jgi:hypothetical protein
MTGLSKPCSLFHAAISTVFAREPRTSMAGDGKMMCRIPKMKIEMPSKTARDVPTRRIRYEITGRNPF